MAREIINILTPLHLLYMNTNALDIVDTIINPNPKLPLLYCSVAFSHLVKDE